MAEIIYLDNEIVATCNKCGGQEWLIYPDKNRESPFNVRAIECTNCGNLVEKGDS